MRIPIAIIGAASQAVASPEGDDPFDPEFFGLSPVEATGLAPAQRVALLSSWEAIESAGCPPASLARTTTGVFLGAWEVTGDSAADPLGVSAAMAVGRICHLLNLCGPGAAVDTGDSSWLYALHEAVHSLRRRECALALAGGPAAGRIAMFVLKRLSAANAARDRVLAVIHDSAIDEFAAEPESLEVLVGITGNGAGRLLAHRHTVTSGSTDASCATVRMSLESREPNEPPWHALDAQLLCISARSEQDLEQQIKQYAEQLRQVDDHRLAHYCFTANAGRSHFFHRAAVVTPTAQLAAEQLTDALSRRPTAVSHGRSRATRLAFLFSGHGSSIAAMGRALYDGERVFRHAFDRCADLARSQVRHRPLSDVFAADATETGDADLSLEHPGLFAFQWALSQLWRSWGVQPDVVLGHSAGECAAACVARALSLEEGVRLTAMRGRLMQSLARGAMVSVSLPLPRVQELIASEHELCVAAINGPVRTVIAGPFEAVLAFADRLSRSGLEHRLLRVPVAAHSPVVEPILDELESCRPVVRAKRPQLPMVSTLTGSWLNTPVDRRHWRHHMRQPVRFGEGITTLLSDGVETFLEIGPDNVLSTLTSECAALAGATIVSLPSLVSGRDGRVQLLETLGSLYVSGIDPDWQNLYRGHTLHKVSLPTYPFQSAGTRAHGTSEPAFSVESGVPTTEAIAIGVRGHVCDILGLAPTVLALDDHFLSLGMDSLRIARCAAVLSSSMRVACSAGDVLAQATCARLAVLLYARLTGAGTSAHATASDHRLRVLNPTGARTPLVCIHPSGGQVGAYLGLSSLLREHPVYAVESRGLLEPALEHDTIVSMAGDYAQTIVRNGLESVALIGWSMGGLVAHAVAQALEAQGRFVPFVGLIDPKGLDLPGHGDDDVRFARQALAHEPDAGATDTETRVDLYLRHFALVRDHHPGTIAARLYIWWAGGGPPSKTWQVHTHGTVTERIISATHFSIMSRPHLDLIANDIAAASAAAAMLTESSRH